MFVDYHITIISCTGACKDNTKSYLLDNVNKSNKKVAEQIMKKYKFVYKS